MRFKNKKIIGENRRFKFKKKDEPRVEMKSTYDPIFGQRIIIK